MNLVFQAIEKTWYRSSRWSVLLRPLSLIYGAVVQLKAVTYRFRVLRRSEVGARVIVVGNLTVGGSGKTPLVVRLVQLLGGAGYSPGVVSRGYRGHTMKFPCLVQDGSNPSLVGDEPLLVHQQTGCPVVTDKDRVRGARYLVTECGVDIVISDDGLQHLRMARAIEIVVIDGERRFGNGCLLPAGPLRESPNRLNKVDFVVTNGGSPLSGEYQMRATINEAVHLTTGEKWHLSQFVGKKVYAIAGTANPAKFFSELRLAGLTICPRSFPDHHPYQSSDLNDLHLSTVLMTSKDAVKCRPLAGPNWWAVPQTIEVDDSFKQALLEMLQQGN
jgi:tetraacyldisaccharide 4'-kinase